jgi:hypothetical protein
MRTNDLEQIVNQIYLTPSDINEHIPTFIKYGTEYSEKASALGKTPR